MRSLKARIRTALRSRHHAWGVAGGCILAIAASVFLARSWFTAQSDAGVSGRPRTGISDDDAKNKSHVAGSQVKRQLQSVGKPFIGARTLQGHPMTGPFNSLDIFIDSLDSYKFDTEWVQFWGALGSPGDTSRPYKIAAPYGLESVEVFRVRYNDDEADFYMGVETIEGWYITKKPLTHVYSPGIMGISERFDILALHQKCIVHCYTRGETPEVVLRFAHSRRDITMGSSELYETADEFLVICGVGPSGHPSCTDVVEMYSSSRIEDLGLDIPGGHPDEHFEIYRNLRVAFRAAICQDLLHFCARIFAIFSIECPRFKLNAAGFILLW